MILNLSNNEFKLVKEGENDLKIVSAKAVPAARPSQIEVKFADENGATIDSTYDFKNEKSMFVLTILLQKVLGVTESTFDTDRINELVGKKVRVLVSHTKKPSSKKEGEFVVFANINRIISNVDDNTSSGETLE